MGMRTPVDAMRCRGVTATVSRTSSLMASRINLSACRNRLRFLRGNRKPENHCTALQRSVFLLVFLEIVRTHPLVASFPQILCALHKSAYCKYYTVLSYSVFRETYGGLILQERTRSHIRAGEGQIPQQLTYAVSVVWSESLFALRARQYDLSTWIVYSTPWLYTAYLDAAYLGSATPREICGVTLYTIKSRARQSFDQANCIGRFN